MGQASELKRVYDDLGQKMKFEKRGVSEVTHLMGLIGMLLALLAAIVRLKRRGHLG